jgi:hypothetical protein
MHFLGVVSRLLIKGQDGANPSWQRQKRQNFADCASSPAEVVSESAHFVGGILGLLKIAEARLNRSRSRKRALAGQR